MSPLETALSAHSHIRTYDLEKRYHGLYAYRLTIDTRKFSLTNKEIDTAFFAYRANYRQIAGMAFLYEELSRFKDDDYRLRTQGNSEFVYLKNEASVVAILNRLGALVTDLTKPRFTADLAALDDDIKVRIRASLYWRKYRWSIRLKTLTKNEFAEIDNWIKSVHGAPKEQLGDILTLSYGYPSKAFFADENDAIMFRIAFSDKISLIEKILLKEEISDEPPVEPSASAQADCP